MTIANFMQGVVRCKLKPSDLLVGDKRFVKQLSEVRNLKQFLFEEKLKFDADQLGSIDLGPLNNLHYHVWGRMPTAEDWKLLDQKLSILASYLNDDLRKKSVYVSLEFSLVPCLSGSCL